MEATTLKAAFREILLLLAVSEGNAAIQARHLSRSPLLTPEERDYSGSRLCRDEARHMKYVRSAVASLGRIDEAQFRTLMVSDFHVMDRSLARGDPEAYDRRLIARFNHDERFLLREFARFQFVLDALLPSEIAAMCSQIKVDEESHVNWGCKVRRRLVVEHPEWRAEIRAWSTIADFPAERIATEIGRIYFALSKQRNRHATGPRREQAPTDNAIEP